MRHLSKFFVLFLALFAGRPLHAQNSLKGLPDDFVAFDPVHLQFILSQKASLVSPRFEGLKRKAALARDLAPSHRGRGRESREDWGLAATSGHFDDLKGPYGLPEGMA